MALELPRSLKPPHRPLSSSFLCFICRILNSNPKKELLRSLRVTLGFRLLLLLLFLLLPFLLFLSLVHSKRLFYLGSVAGDVSSAGLQTSTGAGVGGGFHAIQQAITTIKIMTIKMLQEPKLSSRDQC